MDVRWKFQRLGQDDLERVAVGDPDPTSPTSDPGTAKGYRTCRFEWVDEISRTMTLPWRCTRELGHQGQHIAGTGQCVAVVRDS
jgi:hypothetical protein